MLNHNSCIFFLLLIHSLAALPFPLSVQITRQWSLPTHPQAQTPRHPSTSRACSAQSPPRTTSSPPPPSPSSTPSSWAATRSSSPTVSLARVRPSPCRALRATRVSCHVRSMPSSLASKRSVSTSTSRLPISKFTTSPSMICSILRRRTLPLTVPTTTSCRSRTSRKSASPTSTKHST